MGLDDADHVIGMDTNAKHPINQLDRVICQVRFPALLEVNRRIDEFQKLIREDYPKYNQSGPTPLNLANVPFPTDHNFQSDDGIWTATLSVAAMSLTTTGYTDWDDFRHRFEKLLGAVRDLFEIETCVRVGLRYINAIRPSSIDMPDVEVILKEPYSILTKVSFGRLVGSSLVLDCDMEDGIRSRSNIGLIQFIEGEGGILIDDDIFIENTVHMNGLMPLLDNLNGKSREVFENIASDELISKVMV